MVTVYVIYDGHACVSAHGSYHCYFVISLLLLWCCSVLLLFYVVLCWSLYWLSCCTSC